MAMYVFHKFSTYVHIIRQLANEKKNYCHLDVWRTFEAFRKLRESPVREIPVAICAFYYISQFVN